MRCYSSSDVNKLQKNTTTLLAGNVGHDGRHLMFWKLSVLIAALLVHMSMYQYAHAGVLIRVCDTKAIKAVTDEVCMLFKRSRLSHIKVDKQGQLRIARSIESDSSKLATLCCKTGCPASLFTYNC